MTQRIYAGDDRIRAPSVSSQALYHWGTALPSNISNWETSRSFFIRLELYNIDAKL